MSERAPELSKLRVDPALFCLHLRSKQMTYEVEDRRADRAADPFDATPYWCDATQTGRGPDEMPVSCRDCLPGRSCYAGIDSIA